QKKKQKEWSRRKRVTHGSDSLERPSFLLSSFPPSLSPDDERPVGPAVGRRPRGLSLHSTRPQFPPRPDGKSWRPARNRLLWRILGISVRFVSVSVPRGRGNGTNPHDARGDGGFRCCPGHCPPRCAGSAGTTPGGVPQLLAAGRQQRT